MKKLVERWVDNYEDTSFNIAIVAVVASLLFVFGLLVVKRSELPCMSLTDWATFFAGAFSPPAFIMLIMSQWQQGMQLKEERKRYRLDSKPIFSFSVSIAEKVGDRNSFVLIMENVGALARSVDFAHNSSLFVHPTDHLDEFPSGKKVKVVVSARISDGDKIYDLGMTFRDRHGVKYVEQRKVAILGDDPSIIISKPDAEG